MTDINTVDATFHRPAGTERYLVQLRGLVPGDFLIARDGPTIIEAQGLEIVAPGPYQNVVVQMICGDMPQISVTAWPRDPPTTPARPPYHSQDDTWPPRTYFTIGLRVPTGCCCDLVVAFYRQERDEKRPRPLHPAHVTLRLSRRLA